MTQSERDAISAAARAAGMTLGAYVVHRCLRDDAPVPLPLPAVTPVAVETVDTLERVVRLGLSAGDADPKTAAEAQLLVRAIMRRTRASVSVRGTPVTLPQLLSGPETPEILGNTAPDQFRPLNRTAG